jgi:hypothetical protein
MSGTLYGMCNFGCENLGADVRVGEYREGEIKKMREEIRRLSWSRPGGGSQEGRPRWGCINNSPDYTATDKPILHCTFNNMPTR